MVVLADSDPDEAGDDSVFGPVEEAEPPEDVGPVNVSVGSVAESLVEVTIPEEPVGIVVVPTEVPGVDSDAPELSGPVLATGDDSGVLDWPSVGVLLSPDEGIVVVS